jgi:thioredoxin-related protein
MKRALIGMLLCPIMLFAQNGLNFESGLNWQQIKAKAKTENKYIFVDCFAAWCGPCKLMDKNVYPKDSVGEFINKNFVSVKVQCDTSKSDGDAIKSWYVDAHQIVSEYKITAYPTLLFLSPDGKLVHKGLGYQSPTAFVALGQDAIDPHKQFYTQIKKYQEGETDYSLMPYLASTAQKLQEKELCQSIAADYIRNYLDKLPDLAFFTKENVTFIASYPSNVTSKERLFNWCFHQPAKADTLLHDNGFSSRVVNYVINKEELNPRLETAQKTGAAPDWDAIAKSIKKKFGSEYVSRNILDAKIRWYRLAKDWKNYAKYLVAKIDNEHVEQNIPKDFGGFAGLNGSAWEVFQYSDNKEELEKAVGWSDIVITNFEPKSGPNYGTSIDTKANLLYKLGRKEEALTLEAKAYEIAPKNKGILEAYQKMKEGKPTW